MAAILFGQCLSATVGAPACVNSGQKCHLLLCKCQHLSSERTSYVMSFPAIALPPWVISNITATKTPPYYISPTASSGNVWQSLLYLSNLMLDAQLRKVEDHIFEEHDS